MNKESYSNEPLYKWTFANKHYAHFDTEYCKARTNQIINDLEINKKVSHTFYPFIRVAVPKYKRDENDCIFLDKDYPRHIMHTARIDSNIFSHFRNSLMNKYEEILTKQGINHCVIAYRKIPLSGNNGKGKCNVHFANEAFDEIKDRINKSETCAAITMDISKFFENLDHNIIKKQWARVLEEPKGLPKDHFVIFKNITRYRYIDAKMIQKKLRLKFTDLRKQNIKQICSPKVFREKLLPCLSAENEIGIPQGTAISDVIANMYMLDFDILMNKFATRYSGYYRRYSDDILLIISASHAKKSIKLIKRLLQLTCKTLSINEEKTLVSKFHKIDNKIQCDTYEINQKKFRLIGKPFEYLGLSFDGQTKRIRQSTISKFHLKLTKRIKAECRLAKLKLIKKGIAQPHSNEIFKIISFDKIRDSCMRREQITPGHRGNFYTYTRLIDKVTGESSTTKLFRELNPWIKMKAKKYCEKISRYKNSSLEKT